MRQVPPVDNSRRNLVVRLIKPKEMKRKPSKIQQDLAEVYQRGTINLAELWNTRLRFTPEELMKQNEDSKES